MLSKESVANIYLPDAILILHVLFRILRILFYRGFQSRLSKLIVLKIRELQY